MKRTCRIEAMSKSNMLMRLMESEFSIACNKRIVKTVSHHAQKSHWFDFFENVEISRYRRCEGWFDILLGEIFGY